MKQVTFLNPVDNVVTCLDERFYLHPKKEGLFYPSVTTVLDAWPKGVGFMKWLKEQGSNSEQIVEQASAEGKLIHNMIQDNLSGLAVNWADGRGVEKYPLKIWKMFVKYRKFLEEYRPEILAVEVGLVDTYYKLGGTIDLVCRIRMSSTRQGQERITKIQADKDKLLDKKAKLAGASEEERLELEQKQERLKQEIDKHKAELLEKRDRFKASYIDLQSELLQKQADLETEGRELSKTDAKRLDKGAELLTKTEQKILDSPSEGLTRRELAILERPASELTDSEKQKLIDIDAELEDLYKPQVWLIDFKSSNGIYRKMLIQVSVYAKIWNRLEKNKALRDPDYSPNLIERSGLMHLKALTKGPDRSFKRLQGAGWKVEEVNGKADHYFSLFKMCRKIWDEENPNPRPKNLTLPASFPAYGDKGEEVRPGELLAV